MSKKILVLGKDGQLGKSLQMFAHDSAGLDFVFWGRSDLNLTKLEELRQSLPEKFTNIDAVVNCAAYTAVDLAEEESNLADMINHRALRELSRIAKGLDIPLVHISTDYVFNGSACRPYRETDRTNPQNIYGQSKLAGEQAMLNSGCAGIIIRTSWVYSEFGKNFLKTMIALSHDREQLNVVSDQIGSPTYAYDLAQSIVLILLQDSFWATENSAPEVYHYSNEGVASWFDFATKIMNLTNSKCRVSPIKTEQFPTPAKRPFYSLLDKSKIKQEFGLEVAHWEDSLGKCLQRLTD